MHLEKNKHSAIASVTPDQNGRSDEIDLLDLLRTLWSGKLLIGAAGLAGIVLAIIYGYFLATPLYTAQSVVALQNRTETIVDIDSVVSGLSGDTATVNTEIEVLRSRNLLGRLAERMKLRDDPEFNPFLESDDPVDPVRENDAIIRELQDAITIANIRSSYVYTITVVTEEPAKSTAMADTLAALYIEDQVRVKFEATEQATSWLNDRVSTLKVDLEEAEAKVQDFASNTDVVSAETLTALNRQIKDTRARLEALSATRTAAAARLATLEKAAATRDRASLEAVEPALAQLPADMDPDAFLERADAIVTRARSELARIETQIASLDQSASTLETDFNAQSKDLVTLEQLQREAVATRTIYEYFLQRLKETSVQQGILQADARMISTAALPVRPSSPRRTLALAVGLFAGLLIGAATVLFREMLHNGFRNAEMLEQATGHTVLGQLPLIDAGERNDVLQYLVEKPTSAAAEAVRNLRTSLLLSNIDHPPQVILSTSSLPGEGKTTCSLALAQNFAGMGKKVLLIEGDIRRRVFSEYFKLPDSRGMLSVLGGTAQFADVVQRVEHINADVMLGEQSTTNAADIYSSDRFATFMQEARSRYDIVIIDTPPVLLVSDARIIAHNVDAVVFSVKWDATSRGQVRDAIRQFETAGIQITGLVLSQIDPTGMKRYGYGERYGAYAAYGSSYYHD